MFHFSFRSSFVLGTLSGVLITLCLKHSFVTQQYVCEPSALKPYDKWFSLQGLMRNPLLWDAIRYSNHSTTFESDYLKAKIKVLCIVIVRTPDNVKAQQDTWLKKCTAVETLRVESKRKLSPSKPDKSSWELLCKLLFEIRKFDWVLIVNDKTFVVMENFRYYVAAFSARRPYYLGHAVTLWGTSYNSAIPGYALSRGAVNHLRTQFRPNICTQNTYRGKEDYYLGKYLVQINVTVSSTSDDKGLSTFHPYNLYNRYKGEDNYYPNSVFPVRCCSRMTIAFQSEPSKMYTYDYLLYKLQIFKYGRRGNTPLRHTMPDDYVWKAFVQEQKGSADNVGSEEYYRLWEKVVHDPNSFAASLKKEQLSDDDV